MDKSKIEALARQLADSVPEGVSAARADLASNFSGLISSALDRLDLVTREEFDVQRKVLERTRQRLEALEAELKELEGTRAAGSGQSD
ncbi:MAG: accessory factor UbiK family protein [Gammaproteobacteria bacterium]